SQHYMNRLLSLLGAAGRAAKLVTLKLVVFLPQLPSAHAVRYLPAAAARLITRSLYDVAPTRQYLAQRAGLTDSLPAVRQPALAATAPHAPGTFRPSRGRTSRFRALTPPTRLPQ